MDSLKPLEKNFVCFDKHNISNETNTGQLKHQKINNVQRSVTNEQQRLSGNSGHYATIQDSSNENTLFTPKPGYHNATPAKRESSSDLYVSFNTGDRLPTSPNNERTPGYSYATNGEIHILRDSNNENHQSEQIQQLEHNGNDENSKHDANMSKYQSKGTDDSDDMYLQPNLRRIGESGNDMKISWLSEAHVYHEPDNGLGGTLTSTYDVCRVSSNKIVTAPNKKEKKICSTFKIIPCVNLVLLVAAATASIVAVLMIGHLKELWISDSEPACFVHPCGPYSLSDHVIVSEDLSHINLSITVRCEEGFDFKNKSENQINCVDNTWIGTPECEIPGILTTESTSSLVNVGDSFDISCRLRESSSWQTVMVSRSDHSNDSVSNPLFSITYNHSGIRYDATTFRVNVSTFSDGVHLNLTFNTSNCDDTGVYTCAVIVGDIQDPTDKKTRSTEIKIIERASKIKEIIALTSYDQGDDANVVCKGFIGKDENEELLGEIFVRIYWNEQTSENITSDMNLTHSSGCQVDELVNASFVITNDMHGAELQCIARGDDGSRDKKGILLNVTTTKIQISPPASTVYIGEYFNISTELTYIRGWSTLELREKNCSGTENTIVSIQKKDFIQKNDTPSNLTTEVMIKSDKDNTRARLTFPFQNVTCSDVCLNGGDTEYISRVKIGDSWKSESIKFKKRASKIKEIIASTSYVQGDDANVVCKGLIGTDGNQTILGNISMRIYWNEETSKDITSVIDLTNSFHCQVDALVYASFVITNDMHGAELQCIVRGDDDSLDKKSILLNVTTTKIQISPPASTVDIGEYFNISTELTYIRGWSTLELRKKNCSGAEITIVSIPKNYTQSITKEEHNNLIDSDIDDTRARLTFQFQNVTCSDVCWSDGVIEYISTVEIGDSWVMESESVEFKMNPSVPVLSLEQDKVLKCWGNIGIPSHKMRIIEEKYVLKLPDSSSNITLNTETCENDETITHKVEMEGRRYQCVIIFTNGTILRSNVEILKDTDSRTADDNNNNMTSSAMEMENTLKSEGQK